MDERTRSNQKASTKASWKLFVTYDKHGCILKYGLKAIFVFYSPLVEILLVLSRVVAYKRQPGS